MVASASGDILKLPVLLVIVKEPVVAEKSAAALLALKLMVQNKVVLLGTPLVFTV